MSYTAKVIAVLGRTLRAGRWKLADDSLVIALFGRCVLDLSRAYVDEDVDELSMSVFAFCGSVSIVLPPGCDVEPSGIALLASSEVDIPSDRSEDITHEALAPMDISWIAIFGRVRINELSHEPQPELETATALAAPAVEVFGNDAAAGDIAADSAPAASAASATVTPEAAVPDPTTPDPAIEVEDQAEAAAEAERATLRDEIAQWRTETGRAQPDRQAAGDDDALADDEIMPEPDRTVDSAPVEAS